MDLDKTRFADEDVILKHVELFKDKFMEHFRYKWKKYNKLLGKLKKLEAKQGSSTEVESRDTPCDEPEVFQPVDMDEQDGTVEDPAVGETPSEPQEDAETTNENVEEEFHDDVTDPQCADAAEDGYIDTFLLTLRRKKVRRVISSSHDLREDLLCLMVADTAAELAVAYEYQLSMLAGVSQVNQVARHAVQCIITSLQSRDSSFDSHSLMGAVLDVSLKSATLKRTKIKTIIKVAGGLISDRMFWTVHGFFHKPGLRLLKGSADLDRAERQFEFCGCFSPWGNKCMPEMYGYRGPLFYQSGDGGDAWQMVYNDLASVIKYRQFRMGIPEKDVHADREFHKMYKPCFVCNHTVVAE